MTVPCARVRVCVCVCARGEGGWGREGMQSAVFV